MKQKFVSLLMTAVMLLTAVSYALPISAYADDTDAFAAADTELLSDKAVDSEDLTEETNVESSITENIASGGVPLEPDEDVLNNPVMTPENQAKLDAYKEKIMAELAEDGIVLNDDSASLMTASEDDITFQQYLADYNYNFNCYNFYKNEFKMPYRSFVETRKDSTTYQGLLAAWRIATFSLSDAAKYSNKEIGFYETILYDVLYQGQSVESITGSMEKAMKTTQASSLKSLAAFTHEDSLELLKENLQTWDDESLQSFADTVNKSRVFKDAMGVIGNITDFLGYVNNVEELIYKLAKAQVIMQRSTETAKILTLMESYTSNAAFKAALDNMILVCSNTESTATITYIFSTQMTVGELGEYVLGSVWKDVLSHLDLYGYAISAGQSAGKLLTGMLFSTDEDVELYYSACALYEFENALKSALDRYQNNYLSSKSDENSSVFNEAYKMLLQTHLLSIETSKKIVKIENEKGLLNTLINWLTSNNYDDYYSSLESIKRNIDLTIQHMGTTAYNSYIDEYGGNEVIVLDITKDEEVYSKDDADRAVMDLGALSFETNNITISDDMILTSDLYTYGSVYMTGGTLDLNGYTLTVEGELLQSGGMVWIDGGTLNIGANYIIASKINENNDGTKNYDSTSGYLKMTNEADMVTVKGDFITAGASASGTLTAGTMRVGGNFEQQPNPNLTAVFAATNKHKVIFDGNKTQNIYFSSPNPSGFANAEFENSDITISSGIMGFTLSKDITFKNDIDFDIKGTMDLNGYTINAQKSLYQKDGCLFINGGKLNIGANYIIASKINENNDGTKSYGSTSGYLKMTNEADMVTVKGDFITAGASVSGKLTVGTMRVGGNFEQQPNPNLTAVFAATNKHKVIFDGNKTQNIYFSSPNPSGFAKLQIANKVGTINFISAAKVSSTLTQPGGAEVLNRDNVTLGGKTAFVDYGDLNTTINAYVGNALNVIPTWMDYDAYINQTGPIDVQNYICAIGDVQVSDGEISVAITAKQEINGVIIAAAYTQDGVLIGVAAKDISLTTDTENTKNIAIKTDGAAYISTFIWEDMAGMYPMSEKKEIEL